MNKRIDSKQTNENWRKKEIADEAKLEIGISRMNLSLCVILCLRLHLHRLHLQMKLRH